MQLEDALQKLNSKITTEQDIIQINALDFDPDIGGPNTSNIHNNTAVVSVQELLNSLEPEVANARNTQEEIINSVPPTNTQHFARTPWV